MILAAAALKFSFQPPTSPPSIIGPFTTEFLHIEFMCTFTDFIRIETDTNLLCLISGCSWDKPLQKQFRDNGLIIGSQQRFPLQQIFPLWSSNSEQPDSVPTPLFSTSISEPVIFHAVHPCHHIRIHMGNKPIVGILSVFAGRWRKITVFVQCNSSRPKDSSSISTLAKHWSAGVLGVIRVFTWLSIKAHTSKTFY